MTAMRVPTVSSSTLHVNVDEGWLKGRAANGTIYEDRIKFPSGMKALGDWIHDQVVPGKGKIMKCAYSDPPSPPLRLTRALSAEP